MRIVVKNLPLSTSQAQIQSHFSKLAPTTDIYMLLNKDGVFRRVCFIGYATDELALAAANYFNNTYFSNHKIAVETVEEEPAAPPSETRLRRALYSRTVVVSSTDEAVLEALRKYGPVEDVTLKETKAIVKFKRGEDAEHAMAAKVLGGKRVKIGSYVERKTTQSHYSTLFFDFETVVRRTCEAQGIERAALLDLKDKGLGARVALIETDLVRQTKEFLAEAGIFLDGSIKGKSEDTVILRNSDLMGALDLVKGDFTTRIAPSKCLALLKFRNPVEAGRCQRELNMKRLKNEVIYCEFAPITSGVVNSGSSGVVNSGSNETTTTTDESNNKPLKSKAKKPVNKMIVKNVPFQATVEDLKQIFSTFSHVVDVRVPIKAGGNPRGFAFVIFDTPQSVDEAIEHFGSSTHLYGRRLVLERAKL